MDATSINAIIEAGYNYAGILMSGKIGIIIGSIIGITLLVVVIGLIFSVVRSVRGGGV